jgi:hypothetical protein
MSAEDHYITILVLQDIRAPRVCSASCCSPSPGTVKKVLDALWTSCCHLVLGPEFALPAFSVCCRPETIRKVLGGVYVDKDAVYDAVCISSD